MACLFAAAQAQQKQSESPVQQSKNSGKQESRAYLLGPGDVLEVTIYETTFSTRKVRVDADGYVSSLPFIEPVIAKCRTERQLQQDITAAYRRLIKEPDVSVLIVERNSRPPASVMGAVRQQTKVPVLDTTKLNEVITVSGGFTERAAGTIQILHTAPVMCPEPGQEADSLPIDGTAIPFTVVKIADLRTGVSNPVIRPGDLVLVTEAEPIYITGSVVSPGGILAGDQLTLSRALAMVGGTRNEAKLSEIRIYRQKPGSLEQDIIKVDYAAIRKNQIPDVFLKPYDVVDVSENGVFSGAPWWKLVVGALTGGLQNAIVRPIP